MLLGASVAEAEVNSCVLAVVCPIGIVPSAHWVHSADLTQRVMREFALIMTFPSVAAIGQRDA